MRIRVSVTLLKDKDLIVKSYITDVPTDISVWNWVLIKLPKEVLIENVNGLKLVTKASIVCIYIYELHDEREYFIGAIDFDEDIRG